MRILGIETSSLRGSVALVEGGRGVVSASHERVNAHDASIQPLIEQALAEAGWSPSSLDRIAVGTGPGSFTGLRVGIALAQGLAEGFEIPLVGVGSLESMARAAPGELRGIRLPVLDARRGEFFVAAYTPEGREVSSPRVASGEAELETMARAFAGEVLLLGHATTVLRAKMAHHAGTETDLPHARWTALAAAALAPQDSVRPLYLRPAVAVAPALAPRPLSAEAGPTASALPGSAGAAAGRSHADRER